MLHKEPLFNPSLFGMTKVGPQSEGWLGWMVGSPPVRIHKRKIPPTHRTRQHHRNMNSERFLRAAELVTSNATSYIPMTGKKRLNREMCNCIEDNTRITLNNEPVIRTQHFPNEMFLPYNCLKAEFLVQVMAILASVDLNRMP